MQRSELLKVESVVPTLKTLQIRAYSFASRDNHRTGDSREDFSFSLDWVLWAFPNKPVFADLGIAFL